MDSKIIERVQKLLALAGSSNEHEARLAMAKAQELMIQHQLDQQQVEAHVRLNGDPVEVERRGGRAEMPWRAKYVDGILQHFFKVRVVYDSRNGANNRVANIIGRRTDVQVALYVRAYLLRAFEASFKEYRQAQPTASAAAYFTGLAKGLADQLAADEQRAVTERALVVVRDPALMAKVNELFGRTRPLSGRALRDAQAQAQAAGREAGGRLSIRPGVEGNLGQRRLT